MSTTAGPEEIDGQDTRGRSALNPYSSHKPVPTVQKYYQVQEERRRKEELDSGDAAKDESEGLKNKIKQKLGLEKDTSDGQVPYRSANRNDQAAPLNEDQKQDSASSDGDGESDDGEDESRAGDQSRQAEAPDAPVDTTESNIAMGDAREKRKAMKKREPRGTRIVTDPVTHLQMAIHDLTGKELKNTPENFEAPGTIPRTDTSASKSEKDITDEAKEIARGDEGVKRIFPPPSFDTVCHGLIRSARKALIFWVGGVSLAVAVLFFSPLPTLSNSSSYMNYTIALIPLILGLGSMGLFALFLDTWLKNQIRRSWDDDVWLAARLEEKKQAESPVPESTQWLNRLLASVWPLVNPDLFVSMADLIEDVMQASLPRFVRMVAVEDFGQGSESIRILGVRWLPTAASAKSVDKEGNIKQSKPGEKSDRNAPGEGEVEREHDNANANESEQQEQDDQNIAEGLEKEEGEFVNMEIGFAYRARETDKRLSRKAKNAHLLIKFYLPGSLPIPIWVTLQGFVGIMRVRLQLTPDPPFIALATVTLVGQPKAEMQAIPLTKHFLNVMDLPFISGFVQSSIDAALAEYVAPRSLTLNLKEMLMGDDFKKDTNARGMVYVRIKKAYGFKEADLSIPGLKQGSADPYISVGWAKFGKPVWSTRVILSTMEPAWDEAAFLLVTQEELNAEERLRIQLWDSDRFTADDDVGRIEVDLKDVMHGNARGKMSERKDGFIAMQAKEKLPGKLEWSVGYFPKVRLTEKQLKQQKLMPKVKSQKQLKEIVDEEAERKMREASKRDMSEEIEQNKDVDLAEKERDMAAAAPPPEGFPTGILSIQLHNITGLNLQVLQKSRDEFHNEGAESTEVSDDLPSAYATVILNGQKVFKTRTKPKNLKPFFNASTERVVRDWRHTELMVSVRDARVHEDDPLIGLVYLNLGKIFAKTSQVSEVWPLVGGVGFGRIRISLVFRACTLQLPKQLLGWEYGTLEIGKTTAGGLPADLCGMRLKVKGPMNKGRLFSKDDNGNTTWKRRRHDTLLLGVAHRYSSCITIEFRKTVSGPDKTAAFGVFWLKDIADSIGQTIEIAVWRGGRSKAFERARTHCLEDKDYEGERVGTLKIDMKFWPGLSDYHRKLASKNTNLHSVMEVLDTAKDNNLVQTELYDSRNEEAYEKTEEGQNDSEHSDSSDSDEDKKDFDTNNGNEYYDYDGVTESENDDVDEPDSLSDAKHPQDRGNSRTEAKEEDDGERGPIDQIRDYNKHRKTLHRQHRGAMQWRIPRTAKWAKHKVEAAKDKLVGAVAHHDREPAIETEV